jgi:hypothetical protein
MLVSNAQEYERVIDPTTNSLDAAILDQKVAGMFHGQAYAYVAVLKKSMFGVGIAIDGEHGYYSVDGLEFKTYGEANDFCLGMNRHIGLTFTRQIEITVSSMRKPNRLRLSVENF